LFELFPISGRALAGKLPELFIKMGKVIKTALIAYFSDARRFFSKKF
jgi:hypothetical protein